MRGMRYAVAGILAVGMVAIVYAQPGGGFGFGGGGPTGLVNNKAVQEELKISEEQIAKLKDWAKEFQKTSAKIREEEGVKFGGGMGKIDAEMQAKMSAANVKISKEAYKQLGDVLKKEQVERLRQIEIQNLTIRAFADVQVVEILKLTDTQKASVKGITEDYNKEAKEIRDAASKDAPKGKGTKGGFGGFDPETQKKTQKLAKEYIVKVVDLLDDTQKKAWKEMTGETFDISKLIVTFERPKKD